MNNSDRKIFNKLLALPSSPCRRFFPAVSANRASRWNIFADFSTCRRTERCCVRINTESFWLTTFSSGKQKIFPCHLSDIYHFNYGNNSLHWAPGSMKNRLGFLVGETTAAKWVLKHLMWFIRRDLAVRCTEAARSPRCASLKHRDDLCECLRAWEFRKRFRHLHTRRDSGRLCLSKAGGLQNGTEAVCCLRWSLGLAPRLAGQIFCCPKSLFSVFFTHSSYKFINL